MPAKAAIFRIALMANGSTVHFPRTPQADPTSAGAW